MIEALQQFLRPDQVSTGPDDVAEHSIDKWNFAHPPDVVVFAESTADVAAVLRYAKAEGIPVTTRGAGIGYVGGCVPVQGGIALSVARMNKIREINPADGVAVVEPGVITVDLQDAAREKG